MSQTRSRLRALAGCVAFAGCVAILAGHVDLGISVAAMALLMLMVVAVIG